MKSNTEFIQKFKELQGKTNLNKEFGYTYKVNGSSNIDETGFEGVNGETGIDSIPVPDKIDGLIHSHYNGLLSIFSSDDLYSMCSLYTNNKMNDPSTFILGVVGSDSEYMIMIDDPTKFGVFANLISGKGLEALTYIYIEVYDILPENSVNQNEAAFLEMMIKMKSGLKVFKGNKDMDNWRPKTVDDDGFIVNDPCN